MSRIFVNLFVFCIMCTMLFTGQAFTVCGPNSRLQQCGDLCPRTCEQPAEKFCLPINPSACRRSCRCDKGFVRGPYGVCIRPENCPKRKPGYY